ncbi:hypothetical protein, partial [Klebsiella oxytoca]|uniref:hypothetical protein n=1 Tax=Klebsiella oxytoca TaxID=571 RepID=UPI0034D2DFCA
SKFAFFLPRATFLALVRDACCPRVSLALMRRIYTDNVLSFIACIILVSVSVSVEAAPKTTN